VNQWVKWPKRDGDRSPPASEGVELYLHSSISFHSVVFKQRNNPM